MSNAIFPTTLNGYTWDSKKKPVFNNLVHSSVTGRDVRIALYSQPVFEFTLSNQWLTKADKDMLIGFFLQRQGSFDTFLYTDEDSVATAETFATTDGVTTNFQLKKATQDFEAIVNNPVGSPLIYLNSTLLTAGTDYMIDGNGIVTTGAYAAGNLLKWTGQAYYRCVFLEDSLEYNQFASRLYDCGEIKFKGCMANKL